MYPSITLCRAQEAHHRERATVALLENVRTIAAAAANAWGKEALLAEAREARRDRALQIREVRSEGAPGWTGLMLRPGMDR
jgi:hypothetical protein